MGQRPTPPPSLPRCSHFPVGLWHCTELVVMVLCALTRYHGCSAHCEFAINNILNNISLGKSRGLTAWLWLFKPQARPKAKTKLSYWPGLAQPIWAWLGLAHSLRPGQAQHYGPNSCVIFVVHDRRFSLLNFCSSERIVRDDVFVEDILAVWTLVCV